MFRSISVEYCGESNDIVVGVDGVVSIIYREQIKTYDVAYEDGSVTRVHGVTFAEIAPRND